MISAVLYALVYVFESFVSFYYFDFKFERNLSKWLILLFFSASFIVSYPFHFFEIPIINLALFFVCNFIIAKLCYKTKFKSAIFSSLILTLLMIVTELLVFYFSSILFGTDLYAVYDDDALLIIQTTLCKLIYFLSVHLIMKSSHKENSGSEPKFSLILSILPVASIILMYTTSTLSVNLVLNNNYKLALVIGYLLLLFANIIVFYINELTVRVNKKYTQILLSQQQEKDTLDYYELLKTQNENSKVLIHDIKRHLNTIKQLSTDNNSDISKYISEIVDDFNVMNPVDYCNNPIVNLITNRYCEICKKHNIRFTININNAKLDFMKKHDITALLDNLLENAVEAAEKSEEKFIDFSIVTRNKNFVIIKISNSCAKKPHYINGVIASSKSSQYMHGIGTRSIKRVVTKYNGNLDMNYESDTKTFTSIIAINTHMVS